MDETSGLIAGREADFERLYDRIGPRLLRVALTIACSHAEAEDVVQDAFVNLIKMGPQLSTVRNLDAYLFTTVQRGAIACVARRRRERVVEDLNNTQSSDENESPDFERLRRAVSFLPEEQRLIIALKVDGELSFEKIAEMLQINANTAASRYRYALEKLRASLAPVTDQAAVQRTERAHGYA